MNWSPDKAAKGSSAPFQGRRRAFSVFFAVFVFCLVLAIDTIRRDYLGGTSRDVFKYAIAF